MLWCCSMCHVLSISSLSYVILCYAISNFPSGLQQCGIRNPKIWCFDHHCFLRYLVQANNSAYLSVYVSVGHLNFTKYAWLCSSLHSGVLYIYEQGKKIISSLALFWRWYFHFLDASPHRFRFIRETGSNEQGEVKETLRNHHPVLTLLGSIWPQPTSIISHISLWAFLSLKLRNRRFSEAS